MSPTFFIHIPKTAGTSLNLAATRSFGDAAVERDYGPESQDTSSLVARHVYGNTQDLFAFYQAFEAEKKQWMTGHVFAESYLHLFGARNSIAFVRAPADRVISEYMHRRSHFGLDRDFVDFYRDPAETNKQFRMIGQCPWQAFHMVGSQERYTECLTLLQETKDLDLADMRVNVRPNDDSLAVSDEVKDDINSWNARDCVFYQQVTDYLNKQFLARSKNQPFCYHDVGFAEGQHAIGWAYYGGDNTAVNVGLFVNGALVSETQCSEHRPALQVVGAPRAGNVGFRFVLANHKDAKTIELKALKTDQTLFSWPAP